VSRRERAVLDRREGGWAVVHLGGGPLDLPVWMIPREARDGDALLFSAEEEGGCVRVEVTLAPAGDDDPRGRAAAALERLRGRRS
jgi:hypothetical protein